MEGLISGKDLMERWRIGPYELFHRFIKQGLIAYNEAGQAVSPAEVLGGQDTHASATEKIVAWNQYDLPGADAEAQQMIQSLDSLYFNEDQVRFTGQAFFPDRDEKAVKSIHHTARAKNRARTVAAELWAGKGKDMSVPEIIRTQEMVDATKKPNGGLYSERTVKDWIKDLNPNPPLIGAPKKSKNS